VATIPGIIDGLLSTLLRPRILRRLFHRGPTDNVFLTSNWESLGERIKKKLGEVCVISQIALTQPGSQPLDAGITPLRSRKKKKKINFFFKKRGDENTRITRTRTEIIERNQQCWVYFVWLRSYQSTGIQSGSFA
jgi:hypothetical protein